MNYILFFSENAPNDFQGFLIYAVVTLVGVVGAIWKIYVDAMRKIDTNSQKQMAVLQDMMEMRIGEKQKIIDNLLAEVRQLQDDRVKIIEEVKHSLETSNNIAKSILEFLRNDQK